MFLYSICLYEEIKHQNRWAEYVVKVEICLVCIYSKSVLKFLKSFPSAAHHNPILKKKSNMRSFKNHPPSLIFHFLWKDFETHYLMERPGCKRTSLESCDRPRHWSWWQWWDSWWPVGWEGSSWWRCDWLRCSVVLGLWLACGESFPS